MSAWSSFMNGSLNRQEDRPLRPSTHGADVEERTVEPMDDYATEPYDHRYAADDVTDEPEPIPVWITQAPPVKATNYDWSGATYAIGDSKPIQIAGRDDDRTRLVIRNAAGGNDVLLSASPLVHAYLGFTLSAGADLEMTNNSAVWAVCASGESATVSVLNEFARAE